MEYQFFIFEKKDTYAILTVNRPESLNALSSAVFYEFNTILDSIEADRSVRGLIITGTGRSFVAGADLTEIMKQDSDANQIYARLAQRTYDRIADLPIPVIAAVNGFALGGGCELAMSCDIRIASEKAVFGQPEINMAIIPCFGGTQRLPRLVGEGIAKELIFTGRHIKADEALFIGLVNKVVPAEELISAAEEMMQLMMTKSSKALRYCKAAINLGRDLPLSDGLAVERYLSSLGYASDDKKEGVSAFLEKRKPVFHDF